MFYVAFLLCFKIVYCQDLNPFVDSKILSELPLDKLLQVRNSFKFDEPLLLEASPVKEEQENGPIALALQGKKNLNRDGYDDHVGKHDKTHVQKIFQLSVTSLAFLSFGGYLLCLIVQAIRGKQNAENTTAATQQQILAALIRNQAVRRPYRRRRPNNRLRNRNQNKRRPVRQKRDVAWPNADPENLYYALVSLSEAYTNYHTTDYRHFNQTVTVL